MDKTEQQKLFFRPVCTEKEIERIFNVNNSSDYLLKLRAETIVDHMRLFRVYRNKALLNSKNWSLEKSFNTSHYQSYLKNLDNSIREKCKDITYGNMFSNDPNGVIFLSEYGPIITISESLQFFLKFAHVSLLEFKTKVPMHVRINSLRIAIRVMLKTEALDFFMDPRGILPSDVADAITNPLPLQMEFIAGHEFAHYVLNHLDRNQILDKPIFRAITSHDIDYKNVPVFNKSQKQELEADLHSILMVNNIEHRIELLDAALLWFSCLDMYEGVEMALFPTSPWVSASHPAARQRFENLLENVPKNANYNKKRWVEFLTLVDQLKKQLIKDVSLHIENYETYGSFYFDNPNTEWRGPELIDRVDYY